MSRRRTRNRVPAPALVPAATPAQEETAVPTTVPTTVAPEQDLTPATPEPAAAEPAVTPAPAAAPQRPRRTRRVLRALRTTVVVLALLAAAGAGGTYLVQRRLAAQSFVDVGTAVLTADPVLVGSADAGVVREISVADGDSVTEGQELARVALTSAGDGSPTVQTLRAPGPGLVADVNVAAGGVARPGEPIITLYDPADMAFRAEVPLELLRQLRLGMTVHIEGAGLEQPVTTVLKEVEPQVSTDPARVTSDRLTVVLEPDRADMATVRSLVPGLRFAAVVDTTTATGGTPAVNSA